MRSPPTRRAGLLRRSMRSRSSRSRHHGWLPASDCQSSTGGGCSIGGGSGVGPWSGGGSSTGGKCAERSGDLRHGLNTHRLLIGSKKRNGKKTSGEFREKKGNIDVEKSLVIGLAAARYNCRSINERERNARPFCGREVAYDFEGCDGGFRLALGASPRVHRGSIDSFAPTTSRYRDDRAVDRRYWDARTHRASRD